MSGRLSIPGASGEGADLLDLRAAMLEQHAACLTDWIAEPTPGRPAGSAA